MNDVEVDLESPRSRSNGSGAAPIRFAPISFARKSECYSDQRQPKVIAEMIDYQFKVVRVEGDFIRHFHAESDASFIVLECIRPVSRST
jgi:hypothetical protein